MVARGLEAGDRTAGWLDPAHTRAAAELSATLRAQPWQGQAQDRFRNWTNPTLSRGYTTVSATGVNHAAFGEGSIGRRGRIPLG
jgi:hypothetical protein